MSKANCKFEFNEVKYLHQNLLSYVTLIRRFKRKISGISQIKLTEKAGVELGVHYSCLDELRSIQYNIPGDGYTLDFIKNMKNDKDFPNSFPAFLKRINNANRKVNRFFEDFEMYV